MNLYKKCNIRSLLLLILLYSTNNVFSQFIPPDLTKIGANIELQNRYFLFNNILYNNDFSIYDTKQNYNINFSPFYAFYGQNPCDKFYEYQLTSYGASTSIDANITERLKSGITLTIGDANQTYNNISIQQMGASSYALSAYVKTKTSSNFTIYSSFNHSNAVINTNISSNYSETYILSKHPGEYYSNYSETILEYDFTINKYSITLTPLYGLKIANINVTDIQNIINIESNTATKYNVHGFTQSKYDLLVGGSIARELVRNQYNCKLEGHILLSYNLRGNIYTSQIINTVNTDQYDEINYFNNGIITDIGFSISTQSNNSEFIVSINNSLTQQYSGFNISAYIRKFL